MTAKYHTKPYEYITVEELSNAVDISRWGNTNFRFIGKVVEINSETPQVVIESVQEPDGPYRVSVNCELLDTLPLSGTVVQMFAELLCHDDKVRIKAKICRAVGNMDFGSYNKVIELLNTHKTAYR